MKQPDLLTSIAHHERVAATDFAERLLPPDTRVSVYLFQPVAAPGLRAESPGALWDIGPLPTAVRDTPRDLLYTCAESGRTGSFLQSGDECTRRVPQTTRINAAAATSYRSSNRDVAVRRAQITVEAARHGFTPRNPDGPPEGCHIHHLALAPSVQSFAAVSSGRIPVLGTIFTLTRERDPHAMHEYANLVDYAIFIAGEVLEIRAEHLFGRAHVAAGFEGSALESLLDMPTSDAAVQLAIKLLFAHHWFFPYDPAAWSLLERALGGVDGAREAFARHGWSAPRTHARHGAGERSDADLLTAVTEDLVTLVRHIAWYRLGTEFRARPSAVRDSVALAVNTALLLLCGRRTALPSLRVGARAPRRRDATVFLGPPAALAGLGREHGVVAPVFALSGLQQLVRGRDGGGETDAVGGRFAASLAVCRPGDTGGHTRTHLKPSHFVDGFDHGGAARFSARTRDGLRDRTRWLCSYAIGRLAGMVADERANGRAGSRAEGSARP